MASSFYGDRYPPLVRGTDSGPGAAQNLPAFGHVFADRSDVFVVRLCFAGTKRTVFGNRPLTPLIKSSLHHI